MRVIAVFYKFNIITCQSASQCCTVILCNWRNWAPCHLTTIQDTKCCPELYKPSPSQWEKKLQLLGCSFSFTLNFWTPDEHSPVCTPTSEENSFECYMLLQVPQVVASWFFRIFSLIHTKYTHMRPSLVINTEPKPPSFPNLTDGGNLVRVAHIAPLILDYENHCLLSRHAHPRRIGLSCGNQVEFLKNILCLSLDGIKLQFLITSSQVFHVKVR